MSKILLAVVAVCFAQLAFGRVAREAQDTQSSWLEAFNLANQTIDQFHRAFLNIAGVKSDDELWSKAQTQFKTFETNVRSSVAELNEQAKPLKGKAEELVKSFSAKVTEVTDELKAKNPELFSGDAQKLQTIGERSLRTVVEETNKLRNRLEAEGQQLTPKIEATLKQVYESAVKTAEDFKTQAENAVNAIAKKN